MRSCHLPHFSVYFSITYSIKHYHDSHDNSRVPTSSNRSRGGHRPPFCQRQGEFFSVHPLWLWFPSLTCKCPLPNILWDSSWELEVYESGGLDPIPPWFYHLWARSFTSLSFLTFALKTGPVLPWQLKRNVVRIHETSVECLQGLASNGDQWKMVSGRQLTMRMLVWSLFLA